MVNDSELAFLSSVKRQFEQFQQHNLPSPSLVWLQPGAGISFADAIEMCPITNAMFPNRRPTGAALPKSRRDDDGNPIELILTLPPDKTVNGKFASLATEAGNCFRTPAAAVGVPDFVLSEKSPATRWLRMLFWCALEQPEFPGHTKWNLLNLIDDSSGRYAHIRDAVRCSLYALDWLANQPAESAEPSGETSTDDHSVSEALDHLLEENGQAVYALMQDKSLSANKRMERICEIDPRYWMSNSPFWAQCLGVSQQAITKTKFWRTMRPQMLGTVEEESRRRHRRNHGVD